MKKYKINNDLFLSLLRDNFYSQSTKAEKIGTSQTKISMLETGRKKPDELYVNEFLNFCSFFGVHPVELMEQDNE